MKTIALIAQKGGTGKTTFVKVFWLSSHLPYALGPPLIRMMRSTIRDAQQRTIGQMHPQLQQTLEHAVEKSQRR